MIRYTKDNMFETIENFLLNHQDLEYQTTRYTYYFKRVGDCAGIFRKKRTKNAQEELYAYYHEGEF